MGFGAYTVYKRRIGRVPRHCIVAWDGTALGQPVRLFGDFSCIILALCWYSYVSNPSFGEIASCCVHFGEVFRGILFDMSLFRREKVPRRSSRSCCAEHEALDMNRLTAQNSLEAPTTKGLRRVRGALSFRRDGGTVLLQYVPFRLFKMPLAVMCFFY